MMFVFSSLTCGPGEAVDTELHQQILQMFEEESDQEDFLGFPPDTKLNPVIKLYTIGMYVDYTQ